jgi:hypothetical protein
MFEPKAGAVTLKKHPHSLFHGVLQALFDVLTTHPRHTAPDSPCELLPVPLPCPSLLCNLHPGSRVQYHIVALDHDVIDEINILAVPLSHPQP